MVWFIVRIKIKLKNLKDRIKLEHFSKNVKRRIDAWTYRDSKEHKNEERKRKRIRESEN